MFPNIFLLRFYILASLYINTAYLISCVFPTCLYSEKFFFYLRWGSNMLKSGPPKLALSTTFLSRRDNTLLSYSWTRRKLFVLPPCPVVKNWPGSLPRMLVHGKFTQVSTTTGNFSQRFFFFPHVNFYSHYYSSIIVL